ncbi:MAG TPA: translation initiation factor IF-2 associated domain-containing protein, partial [Alphaproteobacteria bacterium]|nr:translation initiation factor IF-2 associated domain-containing protein [Alphaproteobacteria bacterium]
MSDSKTKEKQTLSLTKEARPMGLRRTVEQAQVKQNFSHGRSKTVQVEVRKKRVAGRAAPPPLEEPQPPKSEPAAVPAPTLRPAAEEEPRVRHVLPTLSEAEKAARARALEDARRADEAARQQAEEQARLRQMEEKRAHAEREAAELRRRAEEDRKRIEEEARRRAEEEADRKLREQQEREGEDEEPAPAPAAEQPVSGRRLIEREAALEAEGPRGRRAPSRRTPSPRRSEPRRRTGRLTIAQALDV